jgi:hypothetical protein
MTDRRWVLAGIAVLLISGAVILGLAWWNDRPADCGGAGGTGDAAGPVASSSVPAEDYWTPERMRDARGAERPATDC